MSSYSQPQGFPQDEMGLPYVVALLKIRIFCTIAAVGGSAIFCWAWFGFSVRNLAVYYRWNEVIFSFIALMVLRRRSFPLAVGTAIFATIWIVVMYLELDKFLP